MDSTKKPIARLENWSYSADGKYLKGLVYESGDLADGFGIITSDLIWIDEENNLAETQHTVYILGKKGK